jgi:hypothetical protein
MNFDKEPIFMSREYRKRDPVVLLVCKQGVGVASHQKDPRNPYLMVLVGEKIQCQNPWKTYKNRSLS